MNATPARPLRVLLLEDSDLDAELISRELAHGGVECEIRRVQTRGDFERQLAEFIPETVIADYRLPAFDGGQALEFAKVNCPDVPFIVVSGAVGEETAVELLKNGATDFVLKDRLARLVPAVRRALREVAERVARRTAESDLKELNEALERRVIERTRELKSKNALMEEDLKLARELQMAFLPRTFPTLPRGVPEPVSAVKFCSIYRPTTSVSGDFFNVVPVSDTSVGVLVCDVMGHGVRAALVAAMMRAIEGELAPIADDPGALLAGFNSAVRGILRQSGTTVFVTAFYLVVDVASARVTFANAGHPSPILVRGDPREVEPISAKKSYGPALGLFDDVPYEAHILDAMEGDVILLFTDGLYEVENANGESFSESRLREAIRRRAGIEPAQLVEAVFSDIEAFAEGQAFTDDVCLIGVEIAHLNKTKYELTTDAVEHDISFTVSG